MLKLLLVSVLLTLASAGCAASSSSPQIASPRSWGSYEVIDHLQFSGVPAGAGWLLGPDELAGLPHVPVEAHQFTIVILPDCAVCKGRVYSFVSEAEAADALAFLAALAADGSSEFTWVYARDNVVVLLAEAVPAKWARLYDSALHDMGD